MDTHKSENDVIMMHFNAYVNQCNLFFFFFHFRFRVYSNNMLLKEASLLDPMFKKHTFKSRDALKDTKDSIIAKGKFIHVITDLYLLLICKYIQRGSVAFIYIIDT